MNAPFFIAKRYLFSKKSYNAINIISFISVCSVAIITIAMICVLSVFNGFEGLVKETFKSFDPDIKITAKEGKVFNYNTEPFSKALKTKGILSISETIEDYALYKYEEQKVPVILKGVSDEFSSISNIKNIIIGGEFKLREDSSNLTVIGEGLAESLNLKSLARDTINIYVPIRNVDVNMANPSSSFTVDEIKCGGIFLLQQPEYDNQVAFIPIKLARNLFNYTQDEVSSLDIKTSNDASISNIKSEIKSIIGDKYIIKDRYEQQIDSYRIIKIEKWISFLILIFILLISVFCIVGSLSMLIVEKKKDIHNFINMGASNKFICKIFLYQGWLISVIGIISGSIIGIILCLIQQNFGLIKLGSSNNNFIINSYPVTLEIKDLIIVIFVVSIVSLFTISYPIKNLKKKLKNKAL